MINPILAAMRDVDGVHGSFVVTRAGALAGKDLPAMFDDAVLTEVGRRIARLHEGLCAAQCSYLSRCERAQCLHGCHAADPACADA